MKKKRTTKKMSLKKLMYILLSIFLFALIGSCTSEKELIPAQYKEPVLSKTYIDQAEINSTFSVQFIDVGQADAALVECDGKYMLIDGGNKGDSSKIYSILSQKEIKKLDIVVGTHAHEDHIGGLPGALNYATADLVLCSTMEYDSKAFKDFKKYADLNGNGIIVPKTGDTYKLGSAEVAVISVNAGEHVNDSSIMLKITYRDTSFIFTGDGEHEAEQMAINSGIDLNANVLKVGHHGSETSTSYYFLREIMPEYAVISVGKDNSYGHPTEKTLSKLKDAEVKTFRTDLQGDILCTSDGKQVSCEVSKNPDADTLTANNQIIQEPVNNNTNQSTPVLQPNEETSTSDNQQTRVWIPRSGKKYHSNPNCSKMKNPSEVSIDEAISRGYTPCKKCY